MILWVSEKLQKHWRITFLFVTIITVVSLFLISRSDFSSNILDMLPLKDRVISSQLGFLSTFKTMERIIFEVSTTNPDQSYEQLADIAGKAINRLKSSDQFTFMADLSPIEFFQLRNMILQSWPSLFTREDSLWVIRRLNRDSLSVRFDHLIAGLYTFSNAAYDTYLLQKDPFGLGQYSLLKLEAFKPLEDVIIREGFITNKANNRILFFAELKYSGMNDIHLRKAKKDIEAVEKYCFNNGFTLTWMGAIRASLDNTDTIKRDVHFTLPIVIVLILLICLFIYSRFHYGALAFLPTILGIIITLAVFLSVTKLSIIILGFGAALLGITVDYAIHYLFQIDNSPKDTNPIQTLAGPIFASALTTAGAFMVLIFAGIPGLAQLGSVTALGIILVAILSLTLLPLCINFAKEKGDRQPLVNITILFASFYSAGYHKRLVFLVLALTLIACFYIPRIVFEGDPNTMNKMKPESIDAERRLIKNWGDTQNGIYLAVTDTTCNEVCKKVENRISNAVEALISLKLAKPVSAFTLLLPSMEVQKENRRRWLQVFDTGRRVIMRQVVDSVTVKYDIKPGIFYPYMEALVSFDSTKNVTQKNYPEFFRNGLLKNYLRHDDSLWYANIPVFPVSGTAWSSIDSIAKEYDVLAVNGAVLGLRIVDIIKTGFFRCLIYIPFVILCILFIMLRSLRYSIVAIIPVFCATGLTLGIMALFHVTISLVSLMVFAFIFGLGIDYTLLMLYMCKKDLSNIKTYASHAAGSITVAAATTLAGLGVLAIAKHPVLSVLGKTGIVGIFSSYLCALILVPILVEIIFKKKVVE